MLYFSACSKRWRREAVILLTKSGNSKVRHQNEFRSQNSFRGGCSAKSQKIITDLCSRKDVVRCQRPREIRPDIGRPIAFSNSIGNSVVTESGASTWNAFHWVPKRELQSAPVFIRTQRFAKSWCPSTGRPIAVHVEHGWWHTKSVPWTSVVSRTINKNERKSQKDKPENRIQRNYKWTQQQDVVFARDCIWSSCHMIRIVETSSEIVRTVSSWTRRIFWTSWVKTMCLPKSSRLFIVGSKEASWEELAWEPPCTGISSSTKFFLNSCSHSGISEFNELPRSIVASFLFVFGFLLAWVSSGCPDPSSTKLDVFNVWSIWTKLCTELQCGS